MTYLSYNNPPNYAYHFAAYRPIIIELVDAYPLYGSYVSNIPVVYLDIYINGTYYKTLSSTSINRQQAFYSSSFSVFYRPIWQFDLQDVMQEYLRSEPPNLSGSTFDLASNTLCQFYTKFRGSTVSSNGFVVPDTPVPVQGNFDVAPVAGGGAQGNTWIAVNNVLQHEDDQNLYNHLAAYKNPLATAPTWALLPLTHRPIDGRYLCCANQYDHFPVFLPWNSLNGGNTTSNQVVIRQQWQNKDGNSYGRTSGPISLFLFYGAPNVINIPTGIPNVAGLAGTGVLWSGVVAGPDPAKVANWFVSLTDYNTDFIIWHSGKITAPDCCDPGTRLHFLNAAGGYDAVSFCDRAEGLTTKSDRYQRSLPATGMQRRSYGNQRYNVRSNETVTLRTTKYDEMCQIWLMELLDSPRVYVEWQSQNDAAPDLIPVIILDGDFVKRKVDDRYEYLFTVTYQPSNENIRQRG